MDYNEVANKQKKIASVMSVKINEDGSCGEICLEAPNDLYLASVNVKREDFVPGKPYYNYVPKDLNYEAMSYRCVKENKIVHSYVDAAFYNAWMEVIMMPLISDEKDKGYYLFSYDMQPKVDTSKLSDISPDIAVQVIRTSIKMRESDDFHAAMDSIIHDLREYCGANRSCILLTDFKKRTASMLCDSVAEDDHIRPDETFLGEGFFDIVEVWDQLIAGSNCYIIHDEKELENLKEVDERWYKSLKHDEIYSLVLFPLRTNGETIGYIMATNFNSEETLNIKSILGVTSFILAAEISNHQLFKRMKILSDTDLLTGLYNRNAMNNRVTDIVSGLNPLTGDYGIVFADLNGLKTVNDNEGHIAGDELLKAAACVLRDAFPEGEIFRVGGDEFLILQTGETEENFNKLVENLRKNSDGSGAVKLAVGTCFGDKNLDIRKAMHEADERMYADKEAYYKKHPELQYRSNR